MALVTWFMSCCGLKMGIHFNDFGLKARYGYMDFTVLG